MTPHARCIPSPACSRTRVYPSSASLNRPKSDISDFGWRDREGARNVIETACERIHVANSPPPHPSPASGGGSRPSSPLALNFTPKSIASNRRPVPSARGHALVAELPDRLLVFRQMREPHSAQHVRRFGELDIVIADDLDSVAPGVEEIEKRTGQRLDARGRERAAHGVFVVDHEAEMTAVVGRLGAALLQRKELVAQIDERRGLALAAQLELEQAAVEGQRLLDIADLERDMVETQGARFSCLRHGSLRSSGRSSCGDIDGIGQYGPTHAPCRCNARGARSGTGHPANAGSRPQELGRITCPHVPFVTSPPLRFGRFRYQPAHKALRRPRPRYCG